MEDELEEQVNSQILRQSDASVKVSLLKVKKGQLNDLCFPLFFGGILLSFFFASHPDDLN